MPPLTIYVHDRSVGIGRAAREGRTVNRDWSNKHRRRFIHSEILLVLVVIYQSIIVLQNCE